MPEESASMKVQVDNSMLEEDAETADDQGAKKESYLDSLLAAAVKKEDSQQCLNNVAARLDSIDVSPRAEPDDYGDSVLKDVGTHFQTYQTQEDYVLFKSYLENEEKSSWRRLLLTRMSQRRKGGHSFTFCVTIHCVAVTTCRRASTSVRLLIA